MRKNIRGRRRRVQRRRDRAQNTVKTLTAGVPRAGAPVGAFGRPMRRIANAVAHGEYLERALGRAETPSERDAAKVALLRQIAKVERLNRVLTR